MTFYSLDKLLEAILAQPQWEKQRRYHELTKCWYQIVNHKVAHYSRPVSVRDDILSVATYSSAWAQDLNLQRRFLITKINRRLEKPIKDIHFSPVKWYQNQYHNQNLDRADNTQEHPSTLTIDSPLNLLPPNTPLESLETWFTTIKKRQEKMKPCPNCHISCPEGELKRWGFCIICFQKKVSRSS